MLVIELNKLIERRRDSWNFEQLEKEWRRLVPDAKRWAQVLDAVSRLKAELRWVSRYRGENVAHQSKADKETIFTALPDEAPSLAKVVELMDMFVEGAIPYKVYLHDTQAELDLRIELGLVIPG
jgi:hypothetical protein